MTVDNDDNDDDDDDYYDDDDDDLKKRIYILFLSHFLIFSAHSCECVFCLN